MLTTKMEFEIKGGMLTISIIYLYTNNLELFEKQLNEAISKSPTLFINMPIVLDLSTLNDVATIDFERIKNIIQTSSLIFIGLKNVPKELLEEAKASQCPVLTDIKKNKSLKSEPKPDAILEQKKVKNMIVNQPVRSGQQVYAQGDLTLLKMVSTGAEILADGNIHVYAPLRGRALAGVNGDQNAQIFCQALYAELISIAGYFKLLEQIPEDLKGKPVRIYLENEQLQIERIV
ncbi:septum site-determining protein MinC [Gammaproteobacteria bacterium]|nr:septum site-determining protein MinC [Gammaproteobacteria bacterium]